MSHRPQQVPGTHPSPTQTPSLDPADWSGFRTQAHRMLDDMISSMEKLREHPVWQPIPATERAPFRSPLPQEPTQLAAVHNEFMETVLPYTARNAHPGFMGYVQGGGTAVGMLAEMLAGALNANLGGRDQIPLDLERQVIEWMRTLFGFPEGASGLCTTGTSMANLIAVTVARDAALGAEVRSQGIAPDPRRLTAYASCEVHGCISRALDLTGLGTDALRLIPSDTRHRLDLNALCVAIAADRAAGLVPFLVVGTAGTVHTGAVDDLAALAAICQSENLWFHVDGALGALAILSPALAPRLSGIERADSLAFDFHKWAQVPYDAGLLLVRKPKHHLQAFATSSSYLGREQRGMAAGAVWPCDLGPELSRGFRALKIWMTLKVYGAHALAKVVDHTCALACKLESLIRLEPELELMAPVELNIVCFRYRFRTGHNPDPVAVANECNRELVIRLQEGGVVAPSTTVLGGRVAIRAAIVNHRTEEQDIQTLLAAVLDHGRRLQQERQPSSHQAPGAWQPWTEREQRLLQIEQFLAASTKGDPVPECGLRYERATLLNQMGRAAEARSEHLKILSIDPAHIDNLLALGKNLADGGQLKAARMVYTEAVRQSPEDVICRVNLGAVLLQNEDAVAACEHYRAALALDPDLYQAHCGMYYALIRLGDPEAAEVHRRRGFRQTPVFANSYRGAAPPIPVLLLVSSKGGNTPIEALLDNTMFLTYTVVADFCTSATPLPEHRLVINGIGDADVADEALAAAAMLVTRTQAPVLNSPTAVRRTGRCDNAAQLAHLPGVIAPRMALFKRALLAEPDGNNTLAAAGFTYPLLLRAPGYHMGQHFEQVTEASHLAKAVEQMPILGRHDTELLAIEYLDARGDDGLARKYRVMIVNGRLYPLHLAISRHWKIHYFSADMAELPEHRAEEARFLGNMQGYLGERATEALARIAEELGLHYGGIDFGLSRAGEVLLFEANATMVAPQPSDDPKWDYRRAAVARIHAAVRSMLLEALVPLPLAIPA